MKTKVIKKIQIFAVVVSMGMGFLSYQYFQPEIFILPKEEVIGTETIHADSLKNYSGKTPGEDIIHLNGKEELEQIDTSAYVTVTTKEIISTGVYHLKPWVDSDSLAKLKSSSGHIVSTGKKVPTVKKSAGVRAESYQEYYLVRMPDSSYCFAQVSPWYKWRLKQREEMILPIGQKQPYSKEVQEYLEDLGALYGADTSYGLYMIDDEWGEKNHFLFFLLRFGVAMAVFFLLAVGLVLVLGKVFPVKEESEP